MRKRSILAISEGGSSIGERKKKKSRLVSQEDKIRTHPGKNSPFAMRKKPSAEKKSKIDNLVERGPRRRIKARSREGKGQQRHFPAPWGNPFRLP